MTFQQQFDELIAAGYRTRRVGERIKLDDVYFRNGKKHYVDKKYLETAFAFVSTLTIFTKEKEIKIEWEFKPLFPFGS